jgi:hypothetical protein
MVVATSEQRGVVLVRKLWRVDIVRLRVVELLLLKVVLQVRVRDLVSRNGLMLQHIGRRGEQQLGGRKAASTRPPYKVTQRSAGLMAAFVFALLRWPPGSSTLLSFLAAVVSLPGSGHAALGKPGNLVTCCPQRQTLTR